MTKMKKRVKSKQGNEKMKRRVQGSARNVLCSGCLARCQAWNASPLRRHRNGPAIAHRRCSAANRKLQRILRVTMLVLQCLVCSASMSQWCSSHSILSVWLFIGQPCVADNCFCATVRVCESVRCLSFLRIHIIPTNLSYMHVHYNSGRASNDHWHDTAATIHA